MAKFTSKAFRVEVRLDGAVFDTPFLWFEVGRILRRVAADVQATLDHEPALILHDINGNACGGAWVSVEPAEPLKFKRGGPRGARITSGG